MAIQTIENALKAHKTSTTDEVTGAASSLAKAQAAFQTSTCLEIRKREESVESSITDKIYDSISSNVDSILGQRAGLHTFLKNTIYNGKPPKFLAKI